MNVVLRGPSGIWIIANCSKNWSLDDTPAKCENAPEKFSYPIVSRIFYRLSVKMDSHTEINTVLSVMGRRAIKHGILS